GGRRRGGRCRGHLGGSRRARIARNRAVLPGTAGQQDDAQDQSQGNGATDGPGQVVRLIVLGGVVDIRIVLIGHGGSPSVLPARQPPLWEWSSGNSSNKCKKFNLPTRHPSACRQNHQFS